MNISRIGITTRSNVVNLAIIWAVGGLGSLAQAAGPSVFTWNSAVSGNWSDSSLWTNDLATGTAPIAAGQQDYTLNFTQAGTYTATKGKHLHPNARGQCRRVEHRWCGPVGRRQLCLHDYH
jgi:hypothetical protein